MHCHHWWLGLEKLVLQHRYRVALVSAVVHSSVESQIHSEQNNAKRGWDTTIDEEVDGATHPATERSQIWKPDLHSNSKCSVGGGYSDSEKSPCNPQIGREEWLGCQQIAPEDLSCKIVR